MHEWMYIFVFMYVRKIPTFYIEARLIFYRGYKFYGDSCLGCLVPKADDIFLFQRLISSQNYHINLGNLDYMASLRASLCEHKGWGTVPLFIWFYSRPRPTTTAC